MYALKNDTSVNETEVISENKGKKNHEGSMILTLAEIIRGTQTTHKARTSRGQSGDVHAAGLEDPVLEDLEQTQVDVRPA